MTLKREWKNYDVLIFLASIIIVAPMFIIISYPFFSVDTLKLSAPANLLSVGWTIFLIACSFVLYVIFRLFFNKLVFYLNVKRYTVRTGEEIYNFPVAARIIKQEPDEGLFNRKTRDVFTVKICLSEEKRKYHTFKGPESYKLTEGKESVKVLVKTYIDQEGEIIYIDPLRIEEE